MSEVVPDLVALDAQIERWRADGARISDAEQPLLAWAWEALSAPQREVALEPAGLLAALRLDGESIAAALLLSAGADELTTAAQDDATRAPVLALMEGARRMDEIQALRPGIESETRDRAEQLEALRKMLLAMVQDARVVLVKMACQVSLLRRLAREGDAAARHGAARDTFELLAPLANRLGVWRLKWELEDLAFRCEDPDTYKAIARDLDGKRADREAFIAAVTVALRQALDLAGIRAEVTGRPKHIYSIWKKMQRKDLGFKDLFDVRAVRVLVDEVRDCYGALGIVHDLWTPIPREFDDYIAKPKANDYRSLHTAVIGPDDKVLEVQIRTREMHQANELGIAAHWRYKEGGRRDPGLEARIAWLRQILDWRQDMTDDAELVDGLRTELFQETVYTLTPQGRVIPLPRGSTPVDFAYHVHTELGHRCRGAKVNGAIVPLTYELGNGQRVEIITTREGGPSRDWLNPQLGFLHSHRARTKVRQWFNAQNLEEAVAHGREVVEREVHRLGAAHPALDALMQTLGFDALDEGLAAVGRGEVSQRDLQHALRPPPPAMVPDPVTPVARVARAPAPQDGVLVVGLDGLLTQLARCCKPVPPDPIVGFVTRGKGVSVHRAGCGNVKRLPVERLVDAAWGNVRPDARYPMDFEITGRADGLLLQAVTDLLGKERMPVRAARVTERGLECRIVLTAETGGLARAERLLTLLSELPGVTQARRG